MSDHSDAKDVPEGSGNAARADVSPRETINNATKAQSDAQQTAQIQKLNHRVLWALVGATLGPLIAVSGLIVSGLQWKTADRQLAAMREQITDTRSATRLEYRAWVFVTKAEIVRRTVRIEARNMGRTPAIDVVMLGRVDSKNPPLLDRFTGALPPSESQVFEIPMFGDWTDAGNVEGHVTYRDVFGEPHDTRFCFGVTLDHGEQPALTRCSANNTTDLGKTESAETFVSP